MDHLDMTVSLSAKDGVIVKLVEAVDDACRLDVLKSLESVHFIHKEVVVRTTYEQF